MDGTIAEIKETLEDAGYNFRAFATAIMAHDHVRAAGPAALLEAIRWCVWVNTPDDAINADKGVRGRVNSATFGLVELVAEYMRGD